MHIHVMLGTLRPCNPCEMVNPNFYPPLSTVEIDRTDRTWVLLGLTWDACEPALIAHNMLVYVHPPYREIEF